MTDKRALIYGLHAVGAVLKRSPERLLELWLAAPRDDERVNALRSQAQIAGAHIHSVGAEALKKMVGEVAHQGAVASIRPLEPLTERELKELAERGEGDALFLVLDGVTDPHNLGACLRSADGAGVSAVIIPKDRAASVDGVVRKASAGAAEFVTLSVVVNLSRSLDMLRAAGVWVVGTAEDAPQSLYQADLKRPLALILGAEGAGMRRLTRDKCDFLVSIPMRGQVESLNVSVATGIALYEARRQQKGPK